MDFFKILIKRILYKIPLKLLVLISIILLLFLCFNNNVFADTESEQDYYASLLDLSYDYLTQRNIDYYNYMIIKENNIVRVYITTSQNGVLGVTNYRGNDYCYASYFYMFSYNYNTTNYYQDPYNRF